MLKRNEFTSNGLLNYLTKKYGLKKNKSKFKLSDVLNYSYRGKLPDEYGGQRIKVIFDENQGIKTYKLISNNDKQSQES